MKQAALSIILAFILSVGIASCSHRSGVPFLDRLGINTDSVLFDSFPEPWYYNTPGNMLTNEQCDSLNTFYYGAKIVSIKQFGENYLLTFIAKYVGMFSILYDKDGKALDQCSQMGIMWPSKEYKDSTFIQKSIDKINGIEKAQIIYLTPPGYVNFHYLTWERHFVDSDKFEITGRIYSTDSIIRYLYKVSNNKITQINKSVTHNIKTMLLDDIFSLPVSQAYLACDLIKDIPNEPKGPVTGSGCIFPSYHWMELLVYYNAPAILKWIADHRGNNDYVFWNLYGFNLFDIFYAEGNYLNNKKPFPKDFITKQIKQMKDKDARDYILKLFADEDARREAELKKYQ